MVYVVLAALGLILGSFVNALVWRVHQQETKSKTKNKKTNLSVINGRSVCPNCRHQLSALDLIPVLSWLMLKGKCRYCHKPISAQYPIVELATGILFMLSFALWPDAINGEQSILLAIWLAILTAFMALTVYDIKWFILPNRIVYPLGGLAIAYALVGLINSDARLAFIANSLFASLIGGGLFYLIYQLSNGKWIGGGDVRLGWILGLLAGTPAKSVLYIFFASLLGTFISVFLIAFKKYHKKQLIPFGPFLIAGLIIVQFYGTQIIDWYTSKILVL